MVCSNIAYLLPPKYVNLVFLLSQGLHLSLQSPEEKDGDGTKDKHSTGRCIEESLVLVEGETMVGPVHCSGEGGSRSPRRQTRSSA